MKDSTIRALNVQQPWASLIESGVKSLEVRTWSTTYRGPVLIVASRAPSKAPEARMHDVDGPRGCTLCIVRLVDVRNGTRADTSRTGGVDPTGFFVWELRRPRPVPRVSIRGRLGLYRLNPVDPLIEELARLGVV